MANRDKIISTLKTSGPMCDDCLSSSSMVKPRQSVNMGCRGLEQHGELQRHKDTCPHCKKVKIINQLQDGVVRPVETKEKSENTREPLPEIIRPRYSEGQFPAGKMEKLVADLAKLVSDEKLEIYNEFSLQHELGILLRNALPERLVQFERNVSFFGFNKPDFEKREIDIVVYDKERSLLDVAIELKFPRNGQHPEQMFSFCKDVVFTEQLKKSGFNKAYVVIFVEDRLFYEGSKEGIYDYFRGGRNLSGTIAKPTGKRDTELTISGSYKVVWNDVCTPLKYAVIEVQ